MTSLLLIGAEQDHERLAGLSRQLTALGYECRIKIATPDEENAPVRSPSTPSNPEGVFDVEPPLTIICWTLASVGAAGAAVQRRAIALKADNTYLGLLLDDVTPPEAVRAAQDIRLVGWEQDNSRGLAPLIAVLRQRTSTPRGLREILVALTETVEGLVARVRKIHLRLRALGIVAGIAVLTFLFAFYADWVTVEDKVCAGSFARGFCRSHGLGHVPSLAEEAMWTRVKPGASCEAFERYLKAYGPNGAFAAEARQRLALAQLSPARKDIALGLTIPWAETAVSTRDGAIQAVKSRAFSSAREQCKQYAQAYAGEAAPGAFVSDVAPDCEQKGTGFVCLWRGNARCVFLVPDAVRSCPASQLSAAELVDAPASGASR